MTQEGNLGVIEKIRTKFDISKITGPFQLLGALVAIIETLLLVWFILATSSFERVAAGSIMAILFVFFMYFVSKIHSTSTKLKLPETGPMVGGEEISINDSIEEELIEKSESEFYTGPEGSYEIQAVPEGWVCKKTTLRGLVYELLEMGDSGIGKKFIELFPELGNVLVMHSKKEFLASPIPGVTKIQDRKIPRVSSWKIRIWMAIIPINRFQPPHYIEQPIYNNLFDFVRGTGLPIRKISQNTISNLSRKNITVELVTEVEKIHVNNETIEKLHINLLAIAIEGDVEDFILAITYPSKPDGSFLSGTEQDIKELRNLANSFKPKRRADSEQIRTKYKKDAEKAFSKYLDENSEVLFYSELVLLFMKLSGWDLDIPKNIVKSIDLLKPFKQASEKLQIENKDLEELWKALDEAETGKTIKLKKEICKTIEKMFFRELEFTIIGLDGLDLDIPQNIVKAIDLLKPLTRGSEKLQIENKDLEELWKALDEAETGKTKKLKKEISKRIEEIKKLPPTKKP